ncbi:MAG: sensor histidine kinase [Gammaproteobacteria bacterium]|nr:MAG: sensor histidine kinase [Gammaproteobacteria bacterium]
MCISAVCGPRSTRSLIRPCCTPSAGPGTSCVKRPRFPRLLASSTFQLTLVYIVLFGASVMLLMGYLYWATIGFMSDQIDETVQAEIKGLAEQYRRQGVGGLISVINERVLRNPKGEALYLLVNRDGFPLAGNLEQWPSAVEDGEGWISFYLTGATLDSELPHIARARVINVQGHYQFLVGRDIYNLLAVRALIERSLVWGVGITLALAVLGGAFMSRSIRRRLEVINQATRRIRSGDLSSRIPRTHSGDEFDELVAHLNKMLDQLEQLMEGIRHVTHNIAHDLRTPLTRLRNRLEFLSRADLSPEVEIQIHEIIDEADQLLNTFNALLRISRIESGGYVTQLECIDLSQLLADCGELYDALAAEKNQTLVLDIQQGICAMADRDLLFQAVVNLLDNAIKYSPEGSSIGLQLRGYKHAIISVWDQGAGIPESERDKVTERFYRIDKDRSTPGNGLGLSMVKAVVELHGGQLELTDNAPGLRVNIILNRAPKREELPGQKAPPGLPPAQA